MSTVRSRNVVEEKNKNAAIVSSSGPKLPPPNLPKISLGSKKRSHSSIKLLPEPQFVSTGSGSKLLTRSEDGPSSKKG
ncbi:hypothetical protein FRX31_033274 [Thalictrum thalictroides]|uniref:Uncharacterized protein n=1 Tax=Thalictrum thalictroides TaxID=46969 RepID=A0A7J6UX11_THATH|nr:hypothetical protein FRX31_033274 [Thalictrum thalictroides]